MKSKFFSLAILSLVVAAASFARAEDSVGASYTRLLEDGGPAIQAAQSAERGRQVTRAAGAASAASETGDAVVPGFEHLLGASLTGAAVTPDVSGEAASFGFERLLVDDGPSFAVLQNAVRVRQITVAAAEDAGDGLCASFARMLEDDGPVLAVLQNAVRARQIEAAIQAENLAFVMGAALLRDNFPIGVEAYASMWDLLSRENFPGGAEYH